jgi:two-component system phosphate regulon sensor histidine kinase PhoR
VAVRIADFYGLHKKRVMWLTGGLQFMVTGALAFLLLNSGFNPLVMIVFVILPVVILQVFAFVVVLRYALSPLDILSRAIAHVSNETNDVTPPNINGTYHERTGLKPMVETIYNLTVNGPTKPAQSTSSGLESTILDKLPSGVIALDANRKIIFANGSAPVQTNSKGEKSIQLIFENEDKLDSWLTHAEKNAVSETHAWARVQNVLPDKPDRRLFDVVAQYAKGGEGGVETLIITIDRTSHYAADEEDMDFIALAAHELRGPITVIRGYLDVLADELHDKVSDDQLELFKRLSVSANRLSGYINNILNVSRYDRRHLQLHLREDKLSDIYTGIADDLTLRASTQNRLLSVDIPADLPTVAADRNSLSEVLANLVDNAIKYSNEGGSVEVTAAIDGDFVKCSVTDHGIGIPSGVVSHLFSKFYRSHRSRQTVAGTGLGLYISKAIIESHGGRIGVSSTEGQGSVFTFSVPIYSTVADKLLSGNNGNEGIIESGSGWIKNHSMYQG